MRKFLLKHCRLYRKLICKMFSKYSVERLTIPFFIYVNFDYCYLGFDKTGTVQKGFTSLYDALRNKGNLGLTTIYDRY